MHATLNGLPQPVSRKRFGSYRIGALVGKGAVGSVYECIDDKDRTLALKMLSRQLSGDDRYRVRFYQEAKLAMRLDHPHIMPAYEVGEHKGIHYYTMDLAERGDLRGQIRRAGPMPERRALQTMKNVAEAVLAAHERGLLHRDVKPGNILQMTDGRVVLADWGFAKEPSAALGITADTEGVGTPQFISPEQFRGAKNVGPAADVYGLGSTLYYLLSGCKPFAEAKHLVDTLRAKRDNNYIPLEERAAGLNRRTIDLVRSAMNAVPQKRPSIAEFIVRLDECIAHRELPETSEFQPWTSLTANVEKLQGPACGGYRPWRQRFGLTACTVRELTNSLKATLVKFWPFNQPSSQ